MNARRNKAMVLFPLIGFLWLLCCTESVTAALQAGVAVGNILVDDPEVPVQDPIYVKTLVLTDEGTTIAIVALDVVGVNRSLVTKIRKHLREELDIEPSNVLVSATHNHHTEQQVAKDLVQRVGRTAKRAFRNLTPVRIGAGTGHENRITMNRFFSWDSFGRSVERFLLPIFFFALFLPRLGCYPKLE